MKLWTFSQPDAKRLLGMAWAVVIAVLVFLALDSIIVKPGTDASIFIYIAKGILEGDKPYLDHWDHKGPLIYFLNLIGILIHDSWGQWVVQGLFLLGACALAFVTLRQAFGLVPALFAVALFLNLFTRFAPPGNFTEQYGLLFQFATLLLFLISQRELSTPRTEVQFATIHLALGALGAASFLLRPNLVALWIAIGLFWLLLRGNNLAKLFWAAVGGAGILMLVSSFFVAVGAWSALWEAVFVFNFAYSDANLQDRLRAIGDLTERLGPVSFLIIASWCVATVFLIRKALSAGPYKDLTILALILLPMEVASISLSGYSGIGYYHYYLTALPVFTVLLAFAGWFATWKQLATPKFLSTLLLFGTITYSLSLSQFAEVADKHLRDGGLTEDTRALLRNYIRETTGTFDRVLVWGHDPRVYLLADRYAPTRFFHQHALVEPGYSKKSIRDEFLLDIKSNTPNLIVDARQPRFPPLSSEDRAAWQPAHRYLHDPEIHRPFFDFVETNYRLADTIGFYRVYIYDPQEVIQQPADRGELIIRSVFDVYRKDRILTFVKDACSQDDAAKRFILHVIPVDRSVIDGKEEANLDFSFRPDDDWQAGNACVVSVELPDYPIAFIRTGQYKTDRTGHDWLEEYRFSEAQ